MPSTLDIQVQANLSQVRERIDSAATRAGRDPSSIRIVAVAKSQPAEQVRAAHRAGLWLIGENRVEEAGPKQAAVPDLSELEWHMVGHIQSRKAKRVAAGFSVVHSVDRLKLAELLDREAGSLGRNLQVFLECNVSGESSKAGWPLAYRSAWPGAAAEFEQLSVLAHLRVGGLMTMAPWAEDPEAVRPVFRRLRELQDYLQQATSRAWPDLSMGMSDDFPIAVEEGATILRLGRAIFGPRLPG
ncbi:MAG: YggS family pyridoxal phosphate-dependent enzyme [Anaerolineales bacterium]